MAQHVAYLVKCYKVPHALVVNTDQMGMHLMPTGGTRTWEEKETKSLLVVRVEDKRQVIVAASSSSPTSSCDILPCYWNRSKTCTSNQ